MKRVEYWGNLNCLINNAELQKDNLVIRMSMSEWTEVININLTSTFLMSKFAIKKDVKK